MCNRTRFLAVMCATTLAACAPMQTSNRSSLMTSARSARNTITADDVQTGRFTDTYNAIQTLRPSWLMRGTSITASRPVQVYLNNMNVGDVAALRDVPLSSVMSIRFLDSFEAASRFGSGHDNGAIVVTTGRRPATAEQNW